MSNRAVGKKSFRRLRRRVNLFKELEIICVNKFPRHRNIKRCFTQHWHFIQQKVNCMVSLNKIILLLNKNWKMFLLSLSLIITTLSKILYYTVYVVYQFVYNSCKDRYSLHKNSKKNIVSLEYIKTVSRSVLSSSVNHLSTMY